MLSEATSEMSPLPKFEVMGREVRAKGVLSGSNYQWFNRRIRDDPPYLGFEFQTTNGSIGGSGMIRPT